ncbi:thiol reductant ABC exporter subunit CydC [Fervidibacillus halotolerans]|uniref:Thiol reductant ABC exporter subunit CydC n=1 Tax=Fervidibacillus halotolerans TaxID=2980027 RepID=A0A9E8M0G7_9BACI|nr:thiol reductant ABC exporter subunit CydC [Fervidibacillus halotolerans]WAA12921.1 thiol reductant ABC exporter subunit CydC [Fervidibacillus halotolerans]
MTLFKTYIFPYIKQYKWMMITTILLGMMTVLAASLLNFTSGYLITRAAEMPLNILMIYVPVVLVRAFGIARPVARYLERLAGHNAVLKILSSMRVKLYDMLEPQALFVRSRFQTGDLIGTLADDIEHLQDAYIRTIFPTITALFLLLYSVITLAVYDWLFALWMFLCLSVIIFVYPLFSLYILKKKQMKEKESKGDQYRALTDAVLGISDWVISGKKERFIRKYVEMSGKTHEAQREIAFWNQSRTFQLHVISGLITIFVGFWAGHEAMSGNILPTYIASFTLVTFPILESLIPVSHAVERIPSYQESLQRIDQINKTVPKEQKKEESVKLGEKPVIEIKNVSYKYDGGKEEAVKSLNLSIPHGQKIAILGRSGSGKSTLLQLLLGVRSPQTGEILIDDTPPEKYGDQIFDLVGVLNQKPYLFATTVENNIRLGKEDATKEEIERVIRQVGLDQYIHSLPKGLDTQMEEAGQRFSGGERQRIALARILLKDTPVVVLDEPTVGLDPETELDLLSTMFNVLKEKTVILITHHLIGLEKMDQIIFMDKGRIKMSGSHKQLMETDERYRQLYQLDRG